MLALLLAAASAQGDQAAQVERFAPQGTVKDLRQASARFSEPMVRFGDPRLPDPFDVDCAAAGRGRWVDARNWVYDFETDLPAGLVCRFTLRAAVTALSGGGIAGPRQFEFSTGGPAVRASLPIEGSEQIDEQQVFLFALDAPATRATIESRGYCAVEHLAEKLPLLLIEGAEREQLLAQRRLLGYSYYRLLAKDGEDGIVQLPQDQLRRREADIVALRCARPLPPETQVDVVWGAGIATPGGVATAADQALRFRTRAPFRARFECDRVKASAPCIPVLPMRLQFTAPIAAAQAAQIRLVGAGQMRQPRPPREASPMVDGVEFAPPFPEAAELEIRLPEGLSDDGGRALQNADRFPLAVATDEAPPLARFNGEFGILEWREGGILPVSLRGVEDALPALRIGGRARRVQDEAEVLRWMSTVARAMRGRWEGGAYRQPGIESVFAAAGADAAPERFELTRPEGGRAFEVIGIPLAEPGFHVVELASPRLGAALLGKPQPRHVATTALVTNLAVHFKWGRQGSLVFVTTLDGAAPVADAELRIVDGCDARPIWNGRSDARGMARIQAGLPGPETWSSCSSRESHPLMISARKDGDFSFALSSWNEGISPHEFNLDTAIWDTPTIAHTLLDRTLLRAGETVSMKHWWREHGAAGLSVPAERPDKLVIEHGGSGQTVELPLRLDAQGVAETQWPIPREARLGEYRLRFEGKGISRDSGSFRVEQYRVPLMRALITPPSLPAVAVTELPLDLFVGYFSGGGAAGLPVKLRTQLRPRQVAFAQHERFRFDGEAVVTGVVEHSGAGYFFEDQGEGAAAAGAAARAGQTLPLTLDANGSARSTVAGLPLAASAQTLVTELEYPDANGELTSVRTQTALWPAALAVGLATDGWTGRADDLRFQALVVDLEGRPLRGRKLRVQLYQRKTHSYRKRLVGGFYAYSHSTETIRLDEHCSARSDAQGLVFCRLAPQASGEIVLEATAADDAGRVARAVSSIWVAGEDEWWFPQGESDRMDLIAARRELEPGETLELQVRMPFRRATALVTVEREGVLDAFVTQLSGREPVIELPMRDGYAPNVFVSVLALRPRVSDFRSRFHDFLRKLGLDRWFTLDGGQPTALVDLSKPAFRLGMTRVDVGWSAQRLQVEVRPQQASYSTRELARVQVQVQPARGGRLPPDAEIAFSAVDEALLDLLPNPSVNLLDAMMQRRGIEVVTSTAQLQVVGKRHYGRKSLAPGGGGGRGAARELLDSLLLWKGRVRLDAQGRATVEVPLNDALTSFRLTAVASAGSDRFGTGSASIRTTQDVQLLAGLPPLVREADRYDAEFTVRNTTGQPLAVEVDAQVLADTAGALPAAQTQALQLPPNSALPVRFTQTAPAGARRLDWTVTVEAQGRRLDALKVTQEVVALHPVRAYQATLLQLTQPLQLEVARPADAIEDRGGIRVNLAASLTASLDGVREYMSLYPYACYEQLASRAVALDDLAAWNAHMARLPGYLDRDGLLQYFPSNGLEGSDTLTAYVLALAHEAGWEIPEPERERMLEGLSRYAQGRIQRLLPLGLSEQAERRLAAIEALSRYGRAQADWLSSLSIEPNLWRTSALIDWIGILQRLHDLPERAASLATAQQILRSRMNLQGSTLGFSAEQDDALWWLMISADVNAVRSVLALLPEAGWRDDLPRLLRGAVGRQQRGHWNLTTANAWGALALRKFAAGFEPEPVTGSTHAQLGREAREQLWRDAPGGTLDLPWPQAPAALALTHDGGGAPWATVQSRAAIPLREPLSSGYRITRTVTPVERKAQGRWTRGDVARVTLEIDAQSDMGWVVVDDPIPAGATLLGGGLGRDSQLLAQGERRQGQAWPAYEERRFDAFRAYYAFVPKGRFKLEYTVRYNNAGRFHLPATRVEAMYAPEMLGEAPNAAVEIASP